MHGLRISATTDATFQAPAGDLVLPRRAPWTEAAILPLVPIPVALWHAATARSSQGRRRTLTGESPAD